MSITLADCLKLSSLKNAKVVSGASGLENIVVSVSVLEYAEPDALQGGDFFRNNELIISAFISIKNDIDAQCRTIRKLHQVGEVGLVLYYVGHFLPEISEKLIETANEIGFPIICMPENNLNLRYSEVIYEIMESIIKDRLQHTSFVGEILERISLLNTRKRTMNNVLRMLGDRLSCSLILVDKNFNPLSIALWSTDSEYNIEQILTYVQYYSGNTKTKKFIEIDIKSDILKVNCQAITVDNNIKLFLVLFKQHEDLSHNYCKQSAEVIQLFTRIWSKNEGNEGTTELIHAILSDEPVKMRRMAEILNINVADINIMWILSSKDNLQNEYLENINSKIIIAAKEFLQHHRRHFITAVFEDKVVIFLDNNINIEESKFLPEIFLEELTNCGLNVFLTLCSNLETTYDVRYSYILFGEAFKLVQTIFPHKSLHTSQELEFAKSCIKIINKGEKSIEKSLSPLSFLMQDFSDSNKDLLNTLSVFLLDTNHSVQEACKILFLHKNTVKYRIKKIDEKLGYSVLKMPESYVLYIAVAVQRLLLGLKLEI